MSRFSYRVDTSLLSAMLIPLLWALVLVAIDIRCIVVLAVFLIGLGSVLFVKVDKTPPDTTSTKETNNTTRGD